MIEDILRSIEISIKNEAWYAALITAIALPDVCGKIEFHTGANKDRYIKWFNKYLHDKYNSKGYNNSVNFLIAENCYKLRCSLIHEASDMLNKSSDENSQLRKISFHTDKHDRGHCNLDCDGKKGVPQLNVANFCNDIVDAVRAWLRDIINDTNKNKELNQLINILVG